MPYLKDLGLLERDRDKEEERTPASAGQEPESRPEPEYSKLSELEDRLARLEQAVADLDERVGELPSREEVEEALETPVRASPTEGAGSDPGLTTRLSEVASRVEKLEGRVPSREDLEGSFASKEDLQQLASRIEELLARKPEEPEAAPSVEEEPEAESRSLKRLIMMWYPARAVGLPSLIDLRRRFGKQTPLASAFIRRSKKRMIPTVAGLRFFKETGSLPPRYLEEPLHGKTDEA